MFTLYTAPGRNIATNKTYPEKRVIEFASDLTTAAFWDHVAAKFENYTRGKANFIASDCVMMDVDNSGSDDPMDWQTGDDIAAAFPDVEFYTVESRNSWKEKDGKQARPKYHVYFPLESPVTDVGDYVKLKQAARDIFPGFDAGAMDAARFFFGVGKPRVEHFPGELTLDRFITTAPDRAAVIGIIEGERNSTMSRKAAQILKRHGDTDKARAEFDRAAESCTPPLDAAELDTIWRSARGFFHRDVETSPGYIDPDDYAAAGFPDDALPPWITIGKSGGVHVAYLRLAREIIKEVPLFYNGHEFLRYDPAQGIWLTDGDLFIEQYIQQEKLKKYTSIQRIRETVKAVKSDIYTSGLFDECAPDTIMLRDGIYRIGNGFSPGFDPAARARNKHSLVYDPAAECPAFEKLMCRLYGADNLPYIYEWFGYCLYRGYPVHEIMTLTGKAGTGKSTLLEILCDFVGAESTAAVKIRKLVNINDRFSNALLVGKTLAYDDDARIMHLEDGSDLKALTGGGRIEAEPKGKPAFMFKNYAKLCFAANEMPSSSDIQGALGRRTTILVTRDTFPTDEYFQLIREIKDEHSGILNHALTGLECVLRAKKFSKSNAAIETVEAWQRENDTVQLFADEAIEQAPGVNIARSKMYRMYVDWCRENGRAALGKQRFNRGFSDKNFRWKQNRTDEWLDVSVRAGYAQRDFDG